MSGEEKELANDGGRGMGGGESRFSLTSWRLSITAQTGGERA